jgi:cob(I)alamin adenosyltransferase
MKIYTRTGDDGSTGLFGGGRVGKSDPRIECYGTIDELNAAIGLAAAAVDRVTASAKADPTPNALGESLREIQSAKADPTNGAPGGGVGSASADVLHASLREIQHELFNIGSHLATPPDSPSADKLPALQDAMISRLEAQMDQADEQLPKLRQFILPAGDETACRLHLARTICRRAERRVVAFAMDRPVPGIIITYLNRLSDWLFVMARLANLRAGVEDVPWKK